MDMRAHITESVKSQMLNDNDEGGRSGFALRASPDTVILRATENRSGFSLRSSSFARHGRSANYLSPSVSGEARRAKTEPRDQKTMVSQEVYSYFMLLIHTPSGPISFFKVSNTYYH